MRNEDNNFDSFADAGEQKVAQLLGSLKRVEAPGDFNARVRARIAQGQPETRRSWMPALVRLGAPAMAFALAAGYFGYTSLYRQGSVAPVTVAETTPAALAPIAQPPVAETAPSAAAVQTTPEIAAVKPPVTSPLVATNGDKKPVTKDKKVDEPAGGSVDMAVREANSIPTRSPEIKAATLSIREVFGSMGVRATFTGSGWRVTSASGSAAAAGLKAGDVIESINGKSAGANSVFDKGFVGSTLRVRRDGASTTISF